MPSAEQPEVEIGQPGVEDQALLERVAQLEQAVESHAVIDQAIGVVMALAGCEREEAFHILRETSQDTNTKLRVLAQEVTAWAARGTMDGDLARTLSRRLPPRPGGQCGRGEHN